MDYVDGGECSLYAGGIQQHRSRWPERQLAEEGECCVFDWGRARFVQADDEEAAERLAVVLRQEEVDVLLTYDPNGGYGHPDHVMAHEVGKRGAELAGVARVLQETVDRGLILRWLKAAGY